MIMRGGTRYAPVWGATDCFQKDVYALCGRECVDCTNEHPDCPDGWELDHEGWCYRMSPDRKNWKDAVKDCASRGGELAHADSFTYDHLIRDVQAHNYIDRWGATKAPGLWIGVGWDIKYGNGWLYTNGTKIKWHNFLRDLPDNLYANGEFCVELRGERPLYEVPLAEHAKLKYYPHWNDAICSDEKHYVCRKRKDAPDDPLPEPDLHMFSSFKMTSVNMFLLLPALYTVLGQ
ncbi:Oidioi.mRNA.OKI2018_I69.chr2.g7829.t1.cds [Oikopleura dioica]|uniref:Oidioi.mRNA.OKI2018_I69.chr2.g7829.t1.cds n=1 Tax=Oikopleura dioica TaxID=34765 RepID=A0ABN7T8H1_OIKDI|nr:Oidioi.mRNA.OKI2018_I69.chr2.g7829.t1.cds [Oikopleura dioica]